MRTTNSTSRQYFEKMYARSVDPWEFATSDYERRKYALTVASLPNDRYANAFEPGCSVGVLTEQLATRCNRLLAVDIIAAPLHSAARRLQSKRHVRFEELTIPLEWPDEIFDLIVLSEVAYYFDTEALNQIVHHIVDSTEYGAHVVGVHWRGLTDYPLTGDQAHAEIDRSRSLRLVVHHIEDEFVLDVWERTT
ncbi:MAG: SAM-dependent methyltransferase [Acidimicrobiales bacterium]